MREHKIRVAAKMNLVATLLLGLVTAEQASAQQVEGVELVY